MSLSSDEAAAQVEEVQLLRSCTTEGEFQWLQAGPSSATSFEEQVRRWEARCEGEDGGANDEPFAFSIRLCAVPECRLEVRMRKSEQEEHQLRIEGKDVQGDELQGLRDACEQRWRASKEEGVEHCIFDVYTALQEHIVDHPLQGTRQEGTEATSTPAASSSSSSTPPSPLTMSRVIFWSHHLIAPSKRRDFVKWSSELSLWTLLKIGWPGYLVFEGKKQDVDEVVKRVKGLQWHAIMVRSEEEWTCEPKEGEDAAELERRALRSCPLASTATTVPPPQPGSKVRTTCEEVEGMSDIVERLRAAGLSEEELVDALGLRTKAGAGPGKSNSSSKQ